MSGSDRNHSGTAHASPGAMGSLEDMFLNAPIGIYTSTHDGRFLYVNPALVRAMGYDSAESVLESITDIAAQVYCDPADREFVLRRMVADGDIRDHECRMRRRDGSKIWVSMSVRAVRGPEGAVQCYQGFVIDITARKQAEEELRRGESRYRRLIRNMPDIVYIFSDLRGGVFWSPSVERILGYSLEELYANPFLWQDAIHPEDRERVTEAIIESSKGRGFDVEYRIRDARGSWRWLHDRSIARHTRSGETFVEGLATDITDRISAEQAIREKNEQLQILLAEKDLFFSIIAHDLISPLTGIHGFTKLLVEEDQAEDWNAIRPVLRAMSQSVQNVLQLLENLLHWSRTLQGLKQCEAGVCDLVKVVDANLELARHVAQQKNVTLRSQVPSGLLLAADDSMLDTIIRNLLFNAVKYTKPGGVVTICAEQREGDITLSVRDTGVGMDRKTLFGLFALGQNTSRPGTAGEPGTGLGLVLCKEFVALHQGMLWAESTPGLGTSFFVALPVHGPVGGSGQQP